MLVKISKVNFICYEYVFIDYMNIGFRESKDYAGVESRQTPQRRT